MNKILLLICLMAFSFVTMGQTDPTQNTQWQGNANNLLVTRGILKADSGFVNARFADTASANINSYLKYYAGSQIFTTSDNALWIRNISATRWLFVGNGTGSSTNTCAGLLSGGVVTWNSLLEFDVSAAIYCINNNTYNSNNGTITLDAADPSLPRIDVIGVDTLGQIFKITGTAAADPAVPQVDPASQLYLTNILVAAGATTPTGVSQVVLWNENTGSPEYTGTNTGAVTNFDNTLNPYVGIKATDVGAWSSTGLKVSVTYSGTAYSTTTYNTLKFFIRLKSTLATTANIYVTLRSGGVAVTSPLLLSSLQGLNKSLTGVYQNISIPFTDFASTSFPSTIDGVRITATGGNANGFYLDYMTLNGGVTTGNTNYLTDVFASNDSLYKVKNGITTFWYKVTGGGGGGIDSTTLSDSLAGFIPLIGTRVGKPVTGSMQTTTISALVSNGTDMGVGIDANLNLEDFQDGAMVYFQKKTLANDATLWARRNDTIANISSIVEGDNSRIEVAINAPKSKGLISTQDFSPNYDYLTYVQKLYVDRVADSLRNYADSIGTIGVNIYNSDGTLTGNRVVTTGGYYLNILGSGAKSTAIGNNSLSSGDSSIAIGNNSLSNSAKGVSIGNYAGYGSTNAIVAIGNNAANGSTGSIVAIGTNAGVNNSANNVTAIGTTAGNNNTGINGTFLGANAGRLNTGSSVTALGKDALNDNSGNETVAIGVVSGRTNTGKAGVYIGNGSGDANIGDSSVLIGYGAGHNNIGSRSVGIGTYSLDNNSGHRVTSIGDSSGVYNTFNSVVNLGIKAISTSNNQLSLSDSIFKIKARGLAKGISGYVLTDTTGNGDLALSSLGNYLLKSDSVATTGFASRGRLTKVADSLIVVANTNYLPKASPSFTGLLSGVGTTQTGSSAVGVVDLSQTWNTTGNVTGIKLNVTNTASGASSRLLDLQVGGVSYMYVTKAGSIATIANLSAVSIYLNSNNKLEGNGSGIIALKDGPETGFNRLQLGGTTSSYPAIARSSNNILIKDAANGVTASLGVGVASVDASAQVEIASTTQGFLPPRMTTTQKNAIASPATGLMVFDTTLAKLCVYTGAAWETITSL